MLETHAVRSISFLDDDIDSAEAFVLRELQMNAVMLVPLVVRGRSWGLVEIYDMRLRRFTVEDEALAAFLVGQAGRRIESLDEPDARGALRRLPACSWPQSGVARGLEVRARPAVARQRRASDARDDVRLAVDLDRGCRRAGAGPSRSIIRQPPSARTRM